MRFSKQPTRWEVCNLAFSAVTQTDSLTPTYTHVVSMAQILEHFGNQDEPQGRALNNAVRYLDVGGMVFSWRWEFDTNAEGSVAAPAWLPSFDHRLLICSDRLDASGQPTALPDWFIPGTPLVGVGEFTTSPPLTQANDEQFPTRIHFQGRNSYVTTLVGGATGSPHVQPVNSLEGRANLRLRLRLDDEHGLFLHAATRVNNTGAPEGQTNVWKCYILGTMYYRFRF